MAHVQIRPNGRGAYKLMVDGVDISEAVLAESVRIEFDAAARPTLRMSLAADTLDADLVDSVIESMRVTERGA